MEMTKNVQGHQTTDKYDKHSSTKSLGFRQSNTSLNFQLPRAHLSAVFF